MQYEPINIINIMLSVLLLKMVTKLFLLLTMGWGLCIIVKHCKDEMLYKANCFTAL